jgi:hypothetical protein
MVCVLCRAVSEKQRTVLDNTIDDEQTGVNIFVEF